MSNPYWMIEKIIEGRAHWWIPKRLSKNASDDWNAPERSSRKRRARRREQKSGIYEGAIMTENSMSDQVDEALAKVFGAAGTTFRHYTPATQDTLEGARDGD